MKALNFSAWALSLTLTSMSLAYAGGSVLDGGYGKPQKPTRLTASLEPADGNSGQGELVYVATPKQRQLMGGITVLVDDKTLDSNGAAAAKAQLQLSNTAVYATCELKIAAMRFAYPANAPREEAADYGLMVGNAKPPKAEGGGNNGNGATLNCVDSAGKAVNPTVAKGDLASVTLTLSGATTPLTTLSGTFE